MKRNVNASAYEPKQSASLNKLLKNSQFSKSLDGIILELTESAVVKRIWVKDHGRRFLPSEFFRNEDFRDFSEIFGDAFSETIGKLMETGVRQECIYADFDSISPEWYRAKFRKVFSGSNETRIICEIENITAEKMLSDQLERKTVEMERINNLFDIGMDLSQMGGWEYDLKTGEFLVTRQVAAIVEADDFILLKYQEMILGLSSIGRYSLLRTLKKSLEQCSPFDLELEANCISKKKWLRIAGITVMENDTVRFFRGIIKDISNHKRHHLELIEAKNMAEQVARKRTEILSIMSHEIRTPLNGIIGVCSLLNQMALDCPDVSELVRHLNFSSNYLLHLVNDTLDLEKINSKKIVLNETETDLRALIEQIKKSFLPSAQVKKLELTVSCDPDIPKFVLIDELRLSRILHNLIGNAVKFTEKGGVSINLKTIKRDEEVVIILFSIMDTGIGIPDHFHNLIFDKFLQVQQASHRKQQGTGLGLSITKGLLKLFRSEIRLRSKPDEGSTFEFEIEFKLPKDSTPDDTEMSARPNLPLLPPFDLLIVDDNQINLLVTQFQVKNFGVAADLAESASIALEMLKNKRYDVILIDLHMPEMDGYALAREVQQIYPHIRRIIFTADVLEEVRSSLKKMGISFILSKPFTPEEIHRILLQVLSE